MADWADWAGGPLSRWCCCRMSSFFFPFSVWLVVRSLTETFVRATELHRSADRWQLTPQWDVQLCLNSGCKVFSSIVGMLATGDQMPLRS